ncbi:hypothetical protein [Hoeflea alexandrii]|uniref:hypothetical protein n=1 Tax=Hoeflea alexandrii TaxID=288436 RepID=UPI0022B0644E|nr:hypothetical protein [Hoeflea alexandrii]MCZ4291318.1 hypothetical protein [Hoeflea alexandrii]
MEVIYPALQTNTSKNDIRQDIPGEHATRLPPLRPELKGLVTEKLKPPRQLRGDFTHCKTADDGARADPALKV